MSAHRQPRGLTGFELRQARRLVDVSQAQVAAAIGCSRQRVGQFEGQDVISLASSRRLVQAIEQAVHARQATGRDR